MFGKMGMARGEFQTLGKSKAKVYVEKDLKTSFEDVAGVDEAKEELREVVQFLKEPAKFSRLGGRTPKGILLVGPPGTGKTLLARAVAGEANVPFFSINGSEFVELFVGLGAARVRDLFEQARKEAPCIIFIDELDALGKSRALVPLGVGGPEEKEQTLNQLLAELDGFDASKGVILLAATNRPEVLDPALLRAGRFDRQVLLDKPDQSGRLQILKVHVKNVKLHPSVSLEQVASLTPGFSGADLANLVNEAALTATRRGAESIEPEDFTVALERIVAGLEHKKRLMNAEEKRRVAHHEMGHATVGLALKTGEKVHKVSVIPRGIGSLGYTLQRPTEDRYLMSRKELLDKMAVLLGGRASESIFFDEVSTGAADDFVKASDIARAMVTQFGMSEKLGMISYEREPAPFLKGTYEAQRASFSERTSEQIDAEVKALMDEAYALAFKTLKDSQRFLEEGAKRLMEKETLAEDEIQGLWKELGNKPREETLRKVR
jgi:cell division protease FtsH